jgi:hypothetical protein
MFSAFSNSGEDKAIASTLTVKKYLSMKNIFLLFVLFLLAPGCKTTQPSSPPAQKKKPHSAKIQPRKKQIFIVIDDAGLSMQQARQFLEIPIPMPVAVMPQRKYSREVARLIAKDPKNEIILHQPMEAL